MNAAHEVQLVTRSVLEERTQQACAGWTAVRVSYDEPFLLLKIIPGEQVFVREVAKAPK